jgi:predicted transposase/invertase (TIGR01784 family)
LEINNPHDKFFKETFSKRKNVIEFIKNVLPKELVENLKLSSLRFDENSYIDDELQEYFTDKVLNCEYKAKQDIIIAILLEHKSHIEKHPHIQLLQYSINIWRSCIKKSRDYYQ